MPDPVNTFHLIRGIYEMNKFVFRSVLRISLALGGFGLVATSTLQAQDWPSWRGRSQNGVSELTNLVSNWSVDGENLIWFQEYIARSTPAVFDGRVLSLIHISEPTRQAART